MDCFCVIFFTMSHKDYTYHIFFKVKTPVYSIQTAGSMVIVKPFPPTPYLHLNLSRVSLTMSVSTFCVMICMSEYPGQTGHWSDWCGCFFLSFFPPGQLAVASNTDKTHCEVKPWEATLE